ncbi:retinoic acid receptor responder protein 2 isoform X1 [Rattus rattus]|uniref:retinoic acid receptor responder protein 2 isoform X1 n=1 Tax=Rattus rattus TaxID=10117 RepID=UPI0013F322C2|nr:retinoic acid receptor responder protein 2 isoform X1 [Rattus rattus]XP_032762488.1 retinoic acid receptor responder protein 2 isoform X1 [Rattus rattus]
MKCLLISLALWLGTADIHGTELELSETQRRGLQVALEEFHRHPPVQWAFQEIGVDSADDLFFSAGTFVRLEFKLQQTNCLKKDWKKPECTIKPNGVSEGALVDGTGCQGRSWSPEKCCAHHWGLSAKKGGWREGGNFSIRVGHPEEASLWSLSCILASSPKGFTVIGHPGGDTAAMDDLRLEVQPF